MNYFNKLPTIVYDNSVAVNILARAKLSDNVKGDRNALLPYTLSDGDRMDLVSHAYYGDPGYSWLVWFSNETVDPYYDMPLTDVDFNDYITTKYGSVPLAQRKIAFYRTNGNSDDSKISIAEFNNLTNGRQKYWAPDLDYLLNLKGYVRNTDIQTINTNRIGTLTLSTVVGTFKIGEEIQQSGTVYAFSTYVSNNELTVQHINGDFTVDSTIRGVESGATATIASRNNAVTSTLAYTDSTYWEPVTFYDFELQQNQQKREILLLDSRYRNQVEQDLKRSMDPL